MDWRARKSDRADLDQDSEAQPGSVLLTSE
jgi:hypothetical protein